MRWRIAAYQVGMLNKTNGERMTWRGKISLYDGEQVVVSYDWHDGLRAEGEQRKTNRELGEFILGCSALVGDAVNRQGEQR